MLARAFDTDGGLGWLIREDARRTEGLLTWFEVSCRLALGHGVSWQAGAGAALWIPPGAWKLGLREQLPLVPSMVRAFGWKRLRRSAECIAFSQRHHPHLPHYYLLALAVDPLHQGRGLGKALMQPVLARCDAERMPAFLETTSEQNVRLYRSRGFEVTDSAPLPGGGPMTFFMWRAPR